MGQIIKTLAILLLISASAYGQSPGIMDLIKEEKTELSLYFYPSTLRMINLERNEEFDELIKDIKKMTFLKLDKHSFDHTQFRELINELTSNEKLEEYIVVEGGSRKMYILGKDSPPATVGLAYFDKEYYAMDIAGTINIKNLPKLYEQLSKNDSTFKNGFVDVFNVMTTHKANIEID